MLPWVFEQSVNLVYHIKGIVLPYASIFHFKHLLLVASVVELFMEYFASFQLHHLNINLKMIHSSFSHSVKSLLE